MRCPNCGETFKTKKGKSLNFCGFCGTNLKTGEKSWTVNEVPVPSLPLNNNIENIKTNKIDTPPISTPDVPKYSGAINSTNIDTTLPQDNNDLKPKFTEYKGQTVSPDSNDKSVIVPPSFNQTNTASVFEPANSGSSFSDISDSVNELDDISESIKELENTPFGSGKYSNTPATSTNNTAEDTIKENVGNGITYMEYTGSNKGAVERTTGTNNSNDDFSAFSLTKPTILPVEENELKFISNDETDKVENIQLSDITEEIASVTEDITPVSEPEPEVEPEPEKEKIISFIGQDKSVAENTLRFKGMEVETIYVTDEKDYDTVIAQSVEDGTEVVVGTMITLTVSAGTWSEWSESASPISNSNYITETMTQSRKRSRTRTIDKRQTTDASEYEDYTLVDTVHKYSGWEVDQYYTSESIPASDTVEIMATSTGFKYSGWFNPANMSAISFSTPDVANFFNSNLSNVKWIYEETVIEQNVKPDVKNWRLAHDSMTKSPAGDPITSNIFFSSHVINGKAYAMKSGTAETQWFIYRRRELEETLYYFEKEIISDWSEWSDWSEQTYTASEDCEVETRTLSRSRRKATAEKQN